MNGSLIEGVDGSWEMTVGCGQFTKAVSVCVTEFSVDLLRKQLIQSVEFCHAVLGSV